MPAAHPVHTAEVAAPSRLLYVPPVHAVQLAAPAYRCGSTNVLASMTGAAACTLLSLAALRAAGARSSLTVDGPWLAALAATTTAASAALAVTLAAAACPLYDWPRGTVLPLPPALDSTPRAAATGVTAAVLARLPATTSLAHLRRALCAARLARVWCSRAHKAAEAAVHPVGPPAPARRRQQATIFPESADLVQLPPAAALDDEACGVVITASDGRAEEAAEAAADSSGSVAVARWHHCCGALAADGLTLADLAALEASWLALLLEARGALAAAAPPRPPALVDVVRLRAMSAALSRALRHAVGLRHVLAVCLEEAAADTAAAAAAAAPHSLLLQAARRRRGGRAAGFGSGECRPPTLAPPALDILAGAAARRDAHWLLAPLGKRLSLKLLAVRALANPGLPSLQHRR